MFIPELKNDKYKATNTEGPSASSSFQLFNQMKRQYSDAYARHKYLVNNYLLYHLGSTNKLTRDTSSDKNDYDIIRANHRFLWTEKDIADAEENWDSNLAKRYYDRLFKEYCIADLSQYKKNLYAMRWRTEKEVFSGKGHFECGNKRCENQENLSSWEVNFAYKEHGERRNALVKLRLCPKCADKLNYHTKRRLINPKTEPKIKHRNGFERINEDKTIVKHHVDVVKKEISSDAIEKPVQKETIPQSSGIWDQKSSALVDAEKTLNDELDEFIDDLLL